LGQLTFESLVSVRTLHISSCLTTSHGSLSSQSLTRLIGHVDRSLENSEEGSTALLRAKGKFGAAALVMVLANWGFWAEIEAFGNDLGSIEKFQLNR
jgi:hypothetical protein